MRLIFGFLRYIYIVIMYICKMYNDYYNRTIFNSKIIYLSNVQCRLIETFTGSKLSSCVLANALYIM